MTVSLLYTTRNRTPLLRRSLARLLTFTLPDEIVIVDDGGDDDCAEACWHYTRQGLPIVYRWIDHPGDTNCCLARNVGIRLADGDDILVCEPEVMFLTDVVAELARSRRTFPGNPLFGCTLKANQPDSGPDDATLIAQYPHFTLYRKEWLFEVGGYDEQLPGSWGFDDVDLNHRLSEAGHFSLLISHARGFHQWHEVRNNAEQADMNEWIVRAKQWPRDIVANQGVTWGHAKTI